MNYKPYKKWDKDSYNHTIVPCPKANQVAMVKSSTFMIMIMIHKAIKNGRKRLILMDFS